MLMGGVLFCAGALLNGFAQAVWMLIVGRILLGLGIGFANQVLSYTINQILFSSDFFIRDSISFLDIHILWFYVPSC